MTKSISARYLIAYIWTGMTLFTCFSASSQPATNLESEIIKLIRYETNMRIEDFPVLSVAAINEQGIEYVSYHYGNPVKNNNETIQNQIFEIGEISQIYSSYLFYHLQQNRILSVSDSITAHLHVKNTSLEKYTLNNLLMNTTGLPEKAPKDIFEYNEAAEEKEKTLEDLIQSYSNTNIKNDIHSFNNTDYALLGRIIEEAHRKNYSTSLNQYLPFSLQFREIHTTAPEFILGHNRIGQAVTSKAKDIYYSANGIICSMKTLTEFIEFLLNDTINEKYFNFVLGDSIENSRFSNVMRHRGWNSVEVSKNKKILLQQGKTEGFISFTAIYPEGKTAVILLTNTSISTEGLGFFILRMVSNYWKK